jgi:hypothetical protein
MHVITLSLIVTMDFASPCQKDVMESLIVLTKQVLIQVHGLKMIHCNVFFVCTDELSCEILRTDASYLKYMPPPSNEDGSLAQVKISIDILGVLEIDETGHYISIFFNLRQDTYVRQYSEFFYILCLLIGYFGLINELK